MTHIIKINPNHVRLASGEKLNVLPEMGMFKDEDYEHSLEVPHMLNASGRQASMIVQPDLDINEGDELVSEYSGFYGVVASIVERRPAKGNWSNNVFTTKPDFVSLKFV